jgi:hypothetical protein
MGPYAAGRNATLIAASGASADAAIDDVFAHFRPPFDLTSNMLFGLTFCPTPPLRRTFPSVPFLSVWGRTPMVVWFARITEVWYRDAAGRPRRATETGQVPYNELNVLALLRHRAVFVPGIYATSRLSVRIGHGYGMPKRLIEMEVGRSEGQVIATANDGTRRSVARAHLKVSWGVLARALSFWWPRWTWPVRFPSGSDVRALIQELPQARIAHLHHSRLEVEEPWLPEPVPLLPLGFYLPGLRMRLPPASPVWRAARVGATP